jgi:plasmid stabilization system protein ParE
MVDRLTARSKQIGQAPLLGAVVSEYDLPDVREVLEWPYRIIYRVKQHEVQILAVIHGAQLPPATI